MKKVPKRTFSEKICQDQIKYKWSTIDLLGHCGDLFITFKLAIIFPNEEAQKIKWTFFLAGKSKKFQILFFLN